MNVGYSAAFRDAQAVDTLAGILFAGDVAQLLGSVVSIAFDQRGSRWTGGNALLTSGALQVTVAPNSTTVGHTQTLRVPIPNTATLSSEVYLSVPLDSAIAYPHENVGVIERSTIVIIGNNAPRQIALPSATHGTPGLAWGWEVFGAWSTIESVSASRGSQYSYPSGVRFHSVGPASIPANSSLTLTVDPAVIEGLAVRSMTRDDGVKVAWHSEASSVPGVHSVAIDSEIPPSHWVQVELSVDKRDDPGLRDSVTYAAVSMTMPGERSLLQRRTGQERDVPVSNAGQPLVPRPAISRN